VDGLAIDGLRDIITTELAFYIRRTIGCISSSFTCSGGADFEWIVDWLFMAAPVQGCDI